MANLVKRLLLPVVLAAGIVPGATGIAAADSIQLDLSGRKPQLRLVNPDDENGYQDRDLRRRDRDDFRCNADRALDKAERMGVRRARVTAMGRKFIEVSGSRRGDRIEITFARDGRCSVVD